MNALRTHLFSSVLLVVIALAAAVPALTQTKPHQKIPPGKDCSSCHKKVYAEWKAGPHGKNDVQCSVCHGNDIEKLTVKPSLAVCGGCHTEHALKPHQKG